MRLPLSTAPTPLNPWFPPSSAARRRPAWFGLFAAWVLCNAGAAAAAAPPAATELQRGRYLAIAADCGSCHTAPGQAPFAGGVPLQTPFGSIAAPNITPDPMTGIGRWTKAEFTRALRQGVRKDGQPLYPAMPYDSYTRLSDADTAALWAYMRSVPAARHAAPANTLRFPFNLRFGVALWQSVYFKAGRFAATAGKSDEWNRGAYLVDALGHCGDCHTPRNLAQASDARRRLEGGRIENWYAPDISSEALVKLGSLSVDELQAYLKTGHMPGNVQSFGPMQEVVHDSLRHLSDGDLHAMAVYLEDQPAAAAAPVPEAAASAAPQFAEGESIYRGQCANCHQPQGEGVRDTVPALAGNAAVTARQAYNVVSAVLLGLDAQGSWAAMPSFARQLTDEQVAAVANYVRNSWGNRSPALATAAMAATLRDSSDVAASGPRPALLCPVLPREVMQAAQKAGAKELEQSLRDPRQLEGLIDGYRSARPRAAPAEVIEALSAAYCRAITAHGASLTRTRAGVIDFSQQVAVAVAQRPAPAAQHPPEHPPAVR